jgi:superkiller protein 3
MDVRRLKDAARPCRLCCALAAAFWCTAALTGQSGADLLQALPLKGEIRTGLRSVLASGDYTAAERLLFAEVDRNGESAPVLVVLGNVLFRNGKHAAAAASLRRAEQLGGLDERNRFLLALACVATEQRVEARKQLEQLAAMSPRNAQYAYWLARLAYQENLFSEALEHATAAVKLQPDFMKAHDQIGLCYEGLNRPDDALAAYQRAVQLNRREPSRSPWPPMNAGKLLFRLNRLEEAEQYLLESVSVDPRFAVARFRLGQVLERRGRYTEALRHLNEATALDPTYAAPFYRLGRIYKLKGDADAAEKALKQFEVLRAQEQARGIRRPD